MTAMLTFFTRNAGAGKGRNGKRREAFVRWTLAAATAIAATVALLVPPLIVTTVTAPEASVLARDDRDAAGTGGPVGTFTGEYADGVPVYRLPPMTVIGERTTSVAAVARRNAMPN